MKRNKGFTLIELLTVIAILAVILLIAAPIILGVLDKARKNTFKNQVLLYVEGLKQQTALALMGSGYSELQKIDEGFYAPTSDSENKLVRVSTTSLNKIMDAPTLTNGEYYFYVESTNQGYNYYIGEEVNQENGYKTTCAYATENEACTQRTYNNNDINIINSNIFGLIHITRNDVVSSSGSGSNSGNSGSTTGSGTNDNTGGNSGTTPQPQAVDYVYTLNQSGITQASEGSTTRQPDPDIAVYYRYPLTNGEIAAGTIPDACVYSERFGELCLEYGNYQGNLAKAKDYYKLGDVDAPYYENIYSSVYSDVTCYNEPWTDDDHVLTCMAGEGDPTGFKIGTNGDASAMDVNLTITCNVWEDSELYCGFY